MSSTATSSASDSSCTTATPGRYGNVPIDACNSNYNYDPQFAPAVAVAVLFGFLAALHVGLAILFRKRYAWVLIMGALWETVAFILHAFGSRDQQNVGYATGWNILFLLAPLWINAFVYMTLARAVYFFSPGRKTLFMPAVGMSKYFVWADVITFIIQGIGGVMATPSADETTIRIGLNIYLAGLGFQEFFILLFLCLMIAFHRDCLAHENDDNASSYKTQPASFWARLSRSSWRRLLYTLYTVLALISVRIFYRIAEFSGGVSTSNPLPYHEIYGYVLDVFPMLLCFIILAASHPGHALVGPDSELPRKTRQQKKAEKRAKKQRKTRQGHSELAQTLPNHSDSESVHDEGGNVPSYDTYRHEYI